MSRFLNLQMNDIRTLLSSFMIAAVIFVGGGGVLCVRGGSYFDGNGGADAYF